MKNTANILAVILSIYLIYSCKKDEPVTPNSDTLKDIDGNIYNTVTIGTQVWMKENLKTTRYNNGTAIPMITNMEAWSSLDTPGYCWYNNDPATFKASYGALYNWYVIDPASNGEINVCPVDWHVANYTDWTTLVTYLGGTGVAGNKLKETGTAHWQSPNSEATNESGFTALPCGYRLIPSPGSPELSDFYGSGIYAQWWSEGSPKSAAIIFESKYSLIGLDGGSFPLHFGSSVRCVKDN